jgi:hypothetical protein
VVLTVYYKRGGIFRILTPYSFSPPQNPQNLLGSLPAGFVTYFQHLFPTLVVVLHDFVQTQGLSTSPEFVAFFADFGSGGEA